MGRHTPRWIKLSLHDRHPKVIALSDRLEISIERALMLAIRWLHYVDQNVEHGRVALSRSQIDAAVDCEGFCDALACESVRWLNRKNGAECDAFTIRKYSTYFGHRQRERAATAERTRRYRSRKQIEHVTRHGDARAEQSRQRIEETSAVSAGGISAGVSACTATEWEQAVALLRECHIAPNCMPQCRQWLEGIASPRQFIQRVKDHALKEGRVGQSLAKYVYGAIRSETQKNASTAVKPPLLKIAANDKPLTSDLDAAFRRLISRATA